MSPNASAINALTANMTETFTLSASDGLLSDTKTLTINLTGVNDIPIMTVAPVVTGTATVGGTLSASTGTWTDADNNTLTYTYQWYRATDAAGTGVSHHGSDLGDVLADHARRTQVCQRRCHRQRRQRKLDRNGAVRLHHDHQHRAGQHAVPASPAPRQSAMR